jgi:tetratricopeptide (TPR) repeat protein
MKIVLVLISFVVSICSYAQDVAVLIKEANNLELKLNEPEALSKYKEAIAVEKNNYTALEKATILSCRIGARSTVAKDKKMLFQQALSFANTAFIIDSNNAKSYYLLALASGRMTDVEEDNKKKIAYIRDTKLYADKALAINPNFGMANFVEGKWHYEMILLNWAKKLAVKALYGGLPTPNLEKCIEHLELCKKQEPYFVLNYLTLAKAYKEDEKAVKMIEILNQLIKLPKRTFDDAAYIEEGKKMLEAEK